VDCGTTKTIISAEECRQRGYTIRKVRGTYKIMVADGSMHTSNLMAKIGRVEAIVMEQPHTLISVKDMLDLGCTLIFHPGGMELFDKDGSLIPIDRTPSGLWTISLDEVEALGARASAPFSGGKDSAREDIQPNREVIRKVTKEDVIKLHEVMGHVRPRLMKRAIETGMWKGTNIRAEDILRLWGDHHCIACIMAKRNRIPISTPSDEKSTVPGEVLSADPVPVSPLGDNGEKWFFAFKDIATGYDHCPVGVSKTEFLKFLKLEVAFYELHGKVVKVLRTDDEAVLKDPAVMAFLAEKKIIAQRSVPYQHYQNSVERDVQTIIKGVSALIHGQYLLKGNKWPYALKWYCDTRNRSPNKLCPDSCPLFRVTGQTTNLANTFKFRFGEPVAVGIAKEHRNWKFDLKRELAVYLGQPEGRVDGHIVFFPFDRKILIRGDVIPLNVTEEQLNRFFASRGEVLNPSGSKEFKELIKSIGLSDLPEASKVLPVKRVIDIPETDRILRSKESNPIVDNCVLVSNFATAEDSSLCGSFYSAIDDSYILANGMRMRTLDNPTVLKAMKQDDAEEWRKCIRAEYLENLIGNGTLIAASSDSIPADAQVIWLTTQLKKKYFPDGKVDKYKARGCGRGDQLRDYAEETYSPTIGALTYSTLQNVALIDRMETMLVDTVAAFLCQDYPFETSHLYVRLEPLVAEICGLDPNVKYQVRKYIYGLPDAGVAYYKEYSKLLMDNGYHKSKYDPCLFYLNINDRRTYVWIHVDDTYLCASDKAGISEFLSVVRSRYEVTTKDTIENYIGVHYEYLEDGSLKLTQPKILKDLFIKHNIKERCAIKTPAAYPTSTPRDLTPVNPTVYLGLLGSFIYVGKSRPEIGFVVSYAATKANTPTESDWQDLLRILQYLYQTQELGLIISKQEPGCDLVLVCYVDASYLLYEDSKGQTGFCLSFNDCGFFYAKSLKQIIVTTSSTHAEMRALFQLITEIIFIEYVCSEIGRALKLPAIILEDNQPVITLMNEEKSVQKGSKHFRMLINYCRERVQDGLIRVDKIASEENIADILTKNLFGNDYLYKRQRLLGHMPGEKILHPVPAKKNKKDSELID
jgi:Reverse transcriptase (RNA-dependent DNA polymerase)